MSKMRLRGLWAVVALEVVAISGLLIWGLVIRQPAKAPTQANTSGQKTERVYGIPKIELQKVAAGLQAPTAIAATDDLGDKRLFVAEQAGMIRVIRPDKSLDDTPFLDIKNKVQNSGEMGLLGLAFHPRSSENRYFYVDYVDKNRNTIVARYAITDVGYADPKSEKVLLKIKQPFTNNKGGQLAFGPDGYLYIGMGDGGGSGDPGNRAQDRNELLGKILRIDVDKGDPYGIPAGNPFAKEGGRAEIWAVGLRNPWRFSFDRQSGDLFIADTGQGNYEEIDLQSSDSTGGEDYGWRCYEGTHSFKADSGCLNIEAYSNPVLQYDHSQGRCSVTGGYVYRGKQFPALAGKYFYADYCGELYYAQSTEDTTGSWQSYETTITGLKIKTFGENSTGELYAADYSTGTIYQVADTAN